jgi:hypothetical protein
MNRLLRPLLRAVMIAATTVTAHGQLGVNIRMNQAQFLAGESVLLAVTLTNHTGNDIILANNGRTPWLDVVVKRGNSEPAASLGRANFGAVKIATGQSMSKTIEVSGLYNLREPGSYSVSVLIRSSENSAGFASNRLLFSIANVRPDWTQKVGVPGQPGKTHEFRIMNFTSSSKSMIYVQVLDSKTGVAMQTVNLGAALLFRKPQAAVDRAQTLNILYLATPEFYVHARIDVNGKFLGRELHKRGADGDPRLVTFADGSVKVAGSIPYDIEAEAQAQRKIRKISERPAYTYN